MARGGSGGEGIIFQEAEGGGLKRNEPHSVDERYLFYFARVFKGLEKSAGYQ